jgi:hypothetical protein
MDKEGNFIGLKFRLVGYPDTFGSDGCAGLFFNLASISWVDLERRERCESKRVGDGALLVRI